MEKAEQLPTEESDGGEGHMFRNTANSDKGPAEESGSWEAIIPSFRDLYYCGKGTNRKNCPFFTLSSQLTHTGPPSTPSPT